MSVNNDPGRIEGMAQDHIGGFSPYARKPSQFLHCRRHVAAEFFHQLPRAFFQRFGLGAKEAQTPNDPLDVRRGRLGKARRVGIATEKFRRDSVYRLIRALGREDDRDQQLKGVSVLERNM